MADKLEMKSSNIVKEHIKDIQKLFPNAVTEVKNGDKVSLAIDFDVLKQELSNELINDKQERYQMTWPDKKKTILLSNSRINATLRPDKSKSVNFDNTKNLYIEGDNLDVLKLLRETYLNKIKLIFIDPPYNTGNDFVYADNFAQTAEDYNASSGQYDEQGNRMVQNTDANGRFHTDWLNMMYARLKIARDLLTDDGAIFVSIDYNEFANLKKIMDEIFGEHNFQREIVWRIGWLSGYKTTAPNFIRNHDTILFYSKNATLLNFNKKYIENKDFKPLVKKDANVKAKLDSLGIYGAKQDELLDFINHGNRTDKYPIEDTWNSNEYDDLNSIAIVSFSGEKISKILDINQDFKGQKSIKMLERIIEAITTNGDIVMDFFSGTGSTAHAVLDLNSKNSEQRKYIMVQLPEKLDESSVAYNEGYLNICDIGEERIRRVGMKIKEEAGLAASDLDIGFRVLKLDSSNMNDVFYDAKSTPQSLFDITVDNVKPNRTPLDLLFQVMLELGIELSANIKEMTISGKQCFIVNENDIVACFDNDISNDVISELAKIKPLYAVFKDSSFKDDAANINCLQILKTYNPHFDEKYLKVI